MGATLQRQCPYCGTRAVAQTVRYVWQNKLNLYRALFQCGHCGEGIIREFALPVFANGGRADLMSYGGDADLINIVIGNEWPSLLPTSAPADCPSNVNGYFHQAADSLNSCNYDASGMMFRKTLESATKTIASDISTMTLHKRIKELVTRGHLTQALGEWADEIRLGGNEAAHDDEPYSQSEAQALRDFTENLLRYLFTLPAAVARRSGNPVGDFSGS